MKKRIAILCQTAPGGKRRLAEEALRLAAGLAATQRCQVDLILHQAGLFLLHPDFYSSSGSWESFLGNHARILIPASAQLAAEAPPHTRLSDDDPEKALVGADLVIRF